MSEQKKIMTESGIEIKPVYTSHETNVEVPGEYPFTRGTTADMYRGKLWTTAIITMTDKIATLELRPMRFDYEIGGYFIGNSYQKRML